MRKLANLCFLLFILCHNGMAQDFGELLFEINEEGISHLDFSPDSQHMSLIRSNDILIYDINQREVIRTFETGYYMRELYYSPNGTRLITVFYNETEEHNNGVILNAVTGKVELLIEDVFFGINGIRFTPDGLNVLFQNREGGYTLYDGLTGEDLRSFKGAGNSIAITGNGNYLFSFYSGTDSVFVSDMINSSPDIVIPMPGETVFLPELVTGVYSAPFDREIIIASTIRGNIHFFDFSSQAVLHTISGLGSILNIDVSDDGRFIAIDNYEETLNYGDVLIYDYETKQLIKNITALKTVLTLTFSPDSSMLATVEQGSSVKLWNVKPAQSGVSNWKYVQ